MLIQTRFIEMVPFPIVKNKIIERQEGKQVEPWLDDARFEIHVRKKRAAIGKGPQDAETLVIDTGAAKKDDNQRNDPAQRIWESGGELSHAKNLHGRTLHPEEHGRLFPEWFEIYIDPRIIVHFDHLPRGLGEIDLVP